MGLDRDNAGRFGLRTFWNVNGEPWHTQANDLPNGVSTWKNNGRPDPGGFNVVGAASLAAVDTGYGLYPTIQLGWRGPHRILHPGDVVFLDRPL